MADPFAALKEAADKTDASREKLKAALFTESVVKELSRHYTDPAEFEEFKESVCDVILEKRQIATSTPQSLLGAMSQMARTGLRPSVDGKGKGSCWLLSRKTNVGTRDKPEYAQTAYVVPSIRESERALFATGSVKNMTGNLVYEQDEFEMITGSNDEIRHVPCLIPQDGKPNPLIAAWNKIESKDGRVMITMMPRRDLKLTNGFMDEKTQLRYAAQRMNMKKVANTWCHDPEFTKGQDFSRFVELGEMSERAFVIESESNSMEEKDPARRKVAVVPSNAGKTVVGDEQPTVEPESTPEKTVTAEQINSAENTRHIPETQSKPEIVEDEQPTVEVEQPKAEASGPVVYKDMKWGEYANAVAAVLRNTLSKDVYPKGVQWIRDNKEFVTKAKDENKPPEDFARLVTRSVKPSPIKPN